MAKRSGLYYYTAGLLPNVFQLKVPSVCIWEYVKRIINVLLLLQLRAGDY